MPEPALAAANSSSNDPADAKTIARDLPPALPLPDVCAEVHAKVDAFLRKEGGERMRRVQEQTRKSLAVIAEALERYSLDELSLSYNGGKDCLVLLILYLTALHLHATTTQPTYSTANHARPTLQVLPSTLQSVYIIASHPFPQIDAFVHESANAYHLSLSRYAAPMKEAFALYLAAHPRVRAIFVGTRRTDPHGADLTAFDPTDRGWPAFMRVHPVIDWHYAEIWTFIRELEVPYCRLYDLGYTSLGGTTDTHPNPALVVSSGGAEEEDARGGGGKFRPAYELVEDKEERLGRDR